MSAAAPEQRERPAACSLVAAGFVLLLMAVGSFALWIGVPAGGMWLASKLTDSFGAHMPVALALILPGMFLTGVGLAWLNDLYLRITGGEMKPARGLRVRRRGPLEPLLAVSFLAALAALFFWFFVLAENPSRGVFGAI